eukprot:9484859-Pyramimonas_sp.AAC.1
MPSPLVRLVHPASSICPLPLSDWSSARLQEEPLLRAAALELPPVNASMCPLDLSKEGSELHKALVAMVAAPYKQSEPQYKQIYTDGTAI